MPNNTSPSGVYYRIYCDANKCARIVEMQDFDEEGYKQSSFLSKTRFPTEDAAIQYLREKHARLPGWVIVDRTLLDIENILDD